MNRAQLLLIAILCVGSLRKFVGAEKVEQGHRDSHHEKDFLHQRTKRYAIGRVPLSYLSVQPSGIGKESGSGYTIDKRYRSNALRTNPAASNFRELQVRQTRRPTYSGNDVSPAQLQAYKNLLQYYGNGGDENTDLNTANLRDAVSPDQLDTTPLTEEELQSLSMLIDAYGPDKISLLLRDLYGPQQPQYFSREDAIQMGKRETGKRAKGQLGQEQPMSFENSLGDNYPMFLNQKRSKRIGNPPKSASSVRIKKETDTAVEASLDKIFGGHMQREDDNKHSTSIPTTAISSSDQIPAPSHTQTKSKKAINWSDYFGIDKRQDKHPEAISSSLSDTSDHYDAEHEHKTINTHNNPDKNDKGKATTSASSSLGSAPPMPTETDKAEKLKEKKDKSRQENDTEDKPDRSWILKEFYKNLAMSTNVKRKRESPGIGTNKQIDKLEKIERKMEEAGDQIIWDTLKYTGAHRDAELSPEQLSQVKNEIIQKLSAAYSLEKIREAIEEFRQQLSQLKDKQQYY